MTIEAPELDPDIPALPTPAVEETVDHVDKPWLLPWEPDLGGIVTTMAIGEEAGSEPDPIDCYVPWEPDFGEATTMALGEEGPCWDVDILLA
jgi:hypothetical protein